MASAEQAGEVFRFLKSHSILCDFRGERWRFGFAIYHIAEDYDLSCLKNYKVL